SNNISLEYLALTIYYIFLFQLTNGEKDLCIGINTHGRYRDELKSIIGLFENIIPLRCQLDPHWCFHQLLEHVQEMTSNSIKYSYFPLQHILNQHPHMSNPVFLDTSFEFISCITDNVMMIGDSQIIPGSCLFNTNEDEILNVSDFCFSITNNVNINQLSCTINASLDLFNRETVQKISQRFHFIVQQLSASIIDHRLSKPIYELPLTLSNEQYLLHSMNNTQTSFSSSSPHTCIHHEFVHQVMKHPQKLAVELDEQSLTYCELLYYVQVLSLALVNEYHVIPGEVICQCVERSVEMVIGIMGIEMAGGVYCPLSPRDPTNRLHGLVEQTQSRLVLVHHLTKTKLDHDTVVLDIDLVLMSYATECAIDVTRLSNVTPVSDGVVYIIFTSGSTGTPKAVQLTQENFINSILAFVQIDVLHQDNVTIQIASIAFDAHLLEIVGSLICGSTILMLHSEGNMDFKYINRMIHEKQVTYLVAVPTYLKYLCDFVEQNGYSPWILIRNISCVGESVSSAFVKMLMHIVSRSCRIWNFYGPAEATLGTLCHLIDVTSHMHDLPIGKTLSNYICSLLNNFLQPVITPEKGELFIGGVGVFTGYLGRDDLTAKALIEIDGQLYYRTGDLVTIDNNGLLHYQGRKDHQIKLHGQRIELGEIERCLLNITSISACVVMKWNDDYLVAYVQSSSSSRINEEQLRQHCQSHLPPHMIPSFFIILDKLPLNANGKIDRKQLPSPDFSLSTLLSSDKSDTPPNQFEERIRTIWRQVLHCDENRISRTTSFFSVGGHSLLFIELYHHYQSVFNFDAHTLSIAPFLQQPTIFQHSQLLEKVISNNTETTQWYTLHINEGIASFAQERIFLDEQVRFSSDIAVYNEVLTLRVVQGTLSLNRLLQAFRYVLNKHKILRTSLMFDNDNGILKQCITDLHKTFTVTMNQTFTNENELRDIIYQTTINPTLFDLSTGRVFHAEILRHQILLNENGNNSNELITNSDVLLIAFHHAAFDRASSSIFFNDLCSTHNTNAISIEEDDELLQYIDYSIHEHLIDMTASHEFWHLQLERYNLEHRLSLPVDRHRLSNDNRSGSASITQISFNNEITQLFLDYASLHHVTPFQLGLSILYVFLFKLTHGENDLCVSCLNANRYRSELHEMIGMFVSTLPYRLEIDSNWPFDELVKHVREKCLSILEHSHYPLQHILADLHLTQSNVSFLETMFDFITISEDDDGLHLNGVDLEEVSLDESYEMAKFDFSLNFTYNQSSDKNQLSCSFVCSSDLFDERTIIIVGRRFQHILEQLFPSKTSTKSIDLCCSSISKIDLILPEEVEERQAIMFERLEIIINEAPASFTQCRICYENRRDGGTDQSSLTNDSMPFFYRLYKEDVLHVEQLRDALQLIVNKHESLHTSLLFDTEKNFLMQRIININYNTKPLFTFIESTYETDEQLNDIIKNEEYNPQLFDLAQGLVFRCHLIYYKQISSNNILSEKDILIFNFHHTIFDYPSMNIFLHDLDQAYKTGQLATDNISTLRYIDYAVIEQEMSMTGAGMFWLDTLHNCKLDQPLSLPYDRYRLANEHRTGRGTSISFDFGQDLSHHFLIYASSNNISLEYLALTIYYIFLFQLTNGEKDLCIGINTHGRYRDELKSIIGLFENIIPLRCQLDPHWCFHQLLEHVQEMTSNSIKYSYFPLQHILNQHPNMSNPVFLDTSFEFISCITDNVMMIGDSQIIPGLCLFNTNEDEILNVSDFCFSIHHNVNINQLSCTINASLDLFNRETVQKISQRFHFIVQQLSASIIDHRLSKSIYELPLTLSNEQYLLHSMNNTQTSFSSSSPHTCIHHEFVYQVMKHPQKLAVELDEQSLTYCELLYYVQVLSLTLVNEYHVLPGEPFSINLLHSIVSSDLEDCCVWNLYGPAETTIASTLHLVDVIANRMEIPIGISLPNYQCVIRNELLQSIHVGQEGELLIGGVGVFAGYLGRDDLTAKALIEIDGQLYYRTGDLVTIDNNGLLHYQGRKD
ncbi:unnamed protein product, partial [Adineta steineri]